jgi:hypothetical protein
MSEFEQSIEKIQDYITSLEASLLVTISEKNELIRQANQKMSDIDSIRKELKEWKTTLDRLNKGV